jgi:hypothetical protein
VVWMIDLELFAKRYSEDGATYKELKKEFNGISFSTINTYRVKLNLPSREKSFARFEVDEMRFRELYESRDPFFTYEEIADVLGCCTSLIVKIKQRLNLPDRAPKPRLVLDEDKFKQMFLAGSSYDSICEEFNFCIFTLNKLKKKHNLPNRKRTSNYNESDFVSSYNEGLSNHKLAKKFSMERRTVAVRIKELNLPPRKKISSTYDDFREAHENGLTVPQLAEKFHISDSRVYNLQRKLGLPYARGTNKTTVVEPRMGQPEPPQAAKNNKTTKTKETIQPVVVEPVIHAEEPVKTKPLVATFSIPPKTLKEIQKIQLQQNIRKAERQYKITHKEHGFGSLIKEELENPIISPFTRSL